MEPSGFGGPSALVCGPRDREGLAHAARLIAGHSRAARPDSRLRWRENGEEREANLADLGIAGAPETSPGIQGFEPLNL